MYRKRQFSIHIKQGRASAVCEVAVFDSGAVSDLAAVLEAPSVVSLGLLLCLSGMVVAAKRRKANG